MVLLTLCQKMFISSFLDSRATIAFCNVKQIAAVIMDSSSLRIRYLNYLSLAFNDLFYCLSWQWRMDYLIGEKELIKPSLHLADHTQSKYNSCHLNLNNFQTFKKGASGIILVHEQLVRLIILS